MLSVSFSFFFFFFLFVLTMEYVDSIKLTYMLSSS